MTAYPANLDHVEARLREECGGDAVFYRWVEGPKRWPWRPTPWAKVELIELAIYRRADQSPHQKMVHMRWRRVGSTQEANTPMVVFDSNMEGRVWDLLWEECYSQALQTLSN